MVSTAAFHARVRGSVPGLGGLKETKLFLPHPRVKVSIVGSLRDREVACSASDRQGSNFESCVWRTVSSQSSHHPQEVLLAQFSLYVHKGGLKPDSFHFISYTESAHRTLGYLVMVFFCITCMLTWDKGGFPRDLWRKICQKGRKSQASPFVRNTRFRETVPLLSLLRYNASLQRQTAVTAHFSSEQLLLFVFARQNGHWMLPNAVCHPQGGYYVWSNSR